jgi:hypothetical protein
MVPASVRVRREAVQPAKHRHGSEGPKIGPGFGLAPATKPAMPPARTAEDKKYQEFLSDMASLGALGGA